MVIKNEVNNSIFFSKIAKALLSYFWVHMLDVQIDFVFLIFVWYKNQECGEQYNWMAIVFQALKSFIKR